MRDGVLQRTQQGGIGRAAVPSHYARQAAHAEPPSWPAPYIGRARLSCPCYRAAMRILFVTSNRIGDAVLSTGLLDHLIRIYPDSRITVACGPVAEGIFARMPNLERLLLLEKQAYGRHWLRLWAATVGTVWDLVVDIRASALAYLVPARRRAVMRKRPGHKTAQLAALLGLDPPPLPVAWTAPQDRERAAVLLPPGSPVIALAPTANWEGKVWPPDRFVGLARALAAGPMAGARVAVFAGPGAQERALAAPVLAALPAAIDLVGTLTLPEAAACLATCALFVGNDSGLMHLAAASGAPTLGLFGPTPATEYAPAGRRTAVAVAHGPAMVDLPVADALAAAIGLIAPATPAAYRLA
jgi:ADP-heptose:LPS heptosyltransferase